MELLGDDLPKMIEIDLIHSGARRCRHVRVSQILGIPVEDPLSQLFRAAFTTESISAASPLT
jgi:hypothetical protein